MTGADMAARLAGWAPEAAEVTETIAAEPALALSGMFDCEPPVAGPGDPIPPLWQWLYFLDRPAQRELGPDGHPAAGQFIPPIPGRRRMYAGGRVSYQAPIRCGDRVTRRSELANWTVRAGRTGELLFVSVRHIFTRGSAILATEEQDFVYRSGPATRSSARAATTLPAAAAASWHLRLMADPVLLFRFSALTYNSHRIHYDTGYATAVEGHPGLVVHGPLLALLCAELPRRHLPARRLSQFSFRARSPLYCGEQLAVSGGLHGGGCTLRVSAPDGTEALTAQGNFAA
ncbi:MAG: FAS1-like dehydratase domain-containing protein [Streptosporangiaceae bacterium]